MFLSSVRRESSGYLKWNMRFIQVGHPKGSRRYMLSVQYDGTYLEGWEPGVVRAIKDALALYVGPGNFFNFKGTSRTDAGVHAVRNTFHVDIVRRRRQMIGAPPDQPPTALSVMRGLNFYLNRPEVR